GRQRARRHPDQGGGGGAAAIAAGGRGRPLRARRRHRPAGLPVAQASFVETAVTGWRKWLRRVVLGLAVLYPVALLLLAIVLRRFGESWWIARVSLYLPRVLFAVPLPLFVLALALLRAWRFLATQVVALGLVLFPLMGLV